MKARAEASGAVAAFRRRTQPQRSVMKASGAGIVGVFM